MPSNRSLTTLRDICVANSASAASADLEAMIGCPGRRPIGAAIGLVGVGHGLCVGTKTPLMSGNRQTEVQHRRSFQF
jgi:hypothetical protein